MFFKKKKQSRKLSFNPETQEPVIRCSICTGEEVAGFRDRSTGHFTEVQLLQSDRDLREFMEACDLETPPRRIY